MWLTESEAAQRWCPMARLAGDGNSGSINRYYTQAGLSKYSWHARCMAGACMMWRWLEEAPLAGLGQTYDIGEPQAVPLEHEQQRERRGYCGLAGKPECFR